VSVLTTTRPGSRKVLHLIPSLGGGGAENFLRNLVRAMQGSRWQSVIVVADAGPYQSFVHELRALGCVVYDLACPKLMRARLWWKVWSVLEDERPDVLQSWMHHADFLGSVTGTLARVPCIAWGVRASEIHRNPTDGWLKTAFLRLAMKWGSRFVPRVIVTNSERARQVHLEMGYPDDVWVRIPNGVDARHFSPNEELRHTVRAELGLSDGQPLIGFVGRFHPVKDLTCFFKAVNCLQAQRRDVNFVIVGGEVDELCPDARVAYDLVQDKSVIHFRPFSGGVHRYYAAMDVFTLCSRSEAFPNVVLEAMATGVPCVTTDAGDCAVMLEGLGRIVPCGDAEALAANWQKKLSLSPERSAQIIHEGRVRIQQHYTLPQVAKRFVHLYDSLVRD
jgi:glycosyltransferase involved in cell wall biosynthesis